MGWIAAIIVGGLAGWLAEQFMKSNMGVLMNIILGIVGAVVANAILGALGVSIGTGWIAYLIVGLHRRLHSHRGRQAVPPLGWPSDRTKTIRAVVAPAGAAAAFVWPGRTLYEV